MTRMESLVEDLKANWGKDEIDLKDILPAVGVTDLDIIEKKDFSPDDLVFWFCKDADDNGYIVRDDSAGIQCISLFDNRDDQLTFAAWNADVDISVFKNWVDADEMKLAIRDAQENEWGF